MLWAGFAAGQTAALGDCGTGSTAGASLPAAGIAQTESRMQEVRAASFPELRKVDVRVRSFHSQADYFRTRFSVMRFFLPVKMRYLVEVNPELFALSAPEDGVCAILAHELSHVSAMSRGNRMREFGLVRLLSKGFTAKFERRTDLEAIHRGYGDGLKSYRGWVYGHVPAENLAAKKRNYFSPEEIKEVQNGLKANPGLYVYWRKHVPLSSGQIVTGAK
jgi:hypothetical protein